MDNIENEMRILSKNVVPLRLKLKHFASNFFLQVYELSLRYIKGIINNKAALLARIFQIIAISILILSLYQDKGR